MLDDRQAALERENAELRRQLDACHAELTEARAQQTATAEVLQVINSSPGDLAPVFDAMLEKAMDLCDAAFGGLWTFVGDRYVATALRGVPVAYAEFLGENTQLPGPGSAPHRFLRGERSVIQNFDLAAEEPYRAGDPQRRALVDLGGARTALQVPLVKDDAVLGVITVYRQEVRPFSDKQIALLQNFAAQAVIAMENARLLTETREALEQQTATAEILQVINSSPGDLAPVFDAMLEKAVCLCDAVFGTLHTFDGDFAQVVAERNLPKAFIGWQRSTRFRPDTERSFIGRSLHQRRTIHVADDAAEEPYRTGVPSAVAAVELGGIRTLLHVPLIKGNTALGVFTIFRQEVRPFNDKQIALLQNFAAQAVIAMENARLLTETREALQHQTATAEVLGVINRSPGDLAPVFDAILEKAHALCGVDHGSMQLYDGEMFRAVAIRGAVLSVAEQLRRPRRPNPNFPTHRLFAGDPFVHVPDLAEIDAPSAVKLAGLRTVLYVALRKEGTFLGFIGAGRKEVRPFSDKQIALLQNFAAQAVIAMENARLLTETREALEQQTATAEVLGVINSSPGDLAPVFDAILEKAHTLCGAAHGHLTVYDGEQFRAVAMHGVPEPFAELLRQPFRPGLDVAGRLLAGDDLIHIPDMAARTYDPDDRTGRAAVELAGIRTLLIIALRKDTTLLGYITAHRQEVRPFSDKQIALLQNFAAQAVIAMENARLLTETREALEQQTATAEVLQVINSSPGDLAPVFDAMLDKAMRLCETIFGALWTYDGQKFQPAAARGPDRLVEFLSERPLEPDPGGMLIRMVEGESVVHNTDMSADAAYSLGNLGRRAFVDLGGAKTGIMVALRKDNDLLGAIQLYRQEVRPFSEKQIALLQNFAAQAVIAMENARLITETREALEQQTATAEVLQVINSSPGDLAPVFDAMLVKALTLCDASFGQLVTFDGTRFRAAAWRGYAPEHGQGTTATPGMALYDLIEGAQAVQITDITADDVYRSGNAVRRKLADEYGARTAIWVALRKEAALLGAFVIYRTEVRPFTDKQIALLQNFAAQAVIAMENARLLTETRETLEQQTATAEVLQVINSSPGVLQPVFDAVLDKALRLCEASFGFLMTYDGKAYYPAADHGHPAFAAWVRSQGRIEPEPGTTNARLAQGETVIQIADAANDPSYHGGSAVRRAVVEIGGFHTMLSLALRKDNALLGAIHVYRQEVRSFSDKQIALLQNFAAQAVIAMENARLLTETREALEQQTATAEVLQVINSSPGDLTPVFDAILQKAHTLCEASFGALMIYDGERFYPVAHQGTPALFREFLAPGIRPRPQDPFGRMAEGATLSHIHDMSEVAAQYPNHPLPRAAADLGGIRTLLIVPLRKEKALLGVITAYRQEVRAFSDKQIALLQSFAAQAVVAMENARLLTETREALEQQTATAEVLQVINSSPGDLAPVFDAMIEKATRLCGASLGTLWAYDGERMHPLAMRGVSPEYAEYLSHQPLRPGAGALGSFVRGEAILHVVDLKDTEAYRNGDAHRRALVDLGGGRSLLGVPLRTDDRLRGAFLIYRREPQPFTDKQISLLQNFAAQAVIAMENARLLGELRQRTGDLQESLEYQTATSDVLKVISQSTFDLEPVLQTVLDTAMRLCGNSQGEIFRLEDGVYRMAVGYGMEPGYHDIEAKLAITPGPDTLVGRTALAGRPVQIVDALADPEYQPKDDARIGKLRSMLGVPLLREGVPIGVICTARKTVEPFTEKQIALVTTFADQAVIAIENARLLNELRERTAELGRSVEELKMLGEVGQAVSSTLDPRGVLSIILNRSVALADADAGAIFRYSRADRMFRFVEAVGYTEAMVREVRVLDVGEHGTGMGVAIATRAPLQIPDLCERPPNPLRDQAIAAGYRSVLIVPLIGADRVLGATILQRRATGEFPAETVRLMQTLASQSVLAIQNARLFREIADKSEQLALASQHKSQFLANMSHELRTPLNAILGYAELLVDGIYGVLPEKAQGVLERVQNNGKHLLALINDVLDLAKIEAGQLVLTIEDYSLPEVVRGVVTATEPLAAAKGLKFIATVEDGVPTAHGDARRVSQVLLNLVGNAIKFTDRGEVAVNASAVNGQFVLTVRDTGPGIADADQERIFGEFQQIENTDTRKKGGTGLGLAISKRMVEMQGGMISVESVLGQGSTFRVVLPVHVEPALEEAA